MTPGGMKTILNPERTGTLINDLSDLWRASVRASHDFLTSEEIAGLLPTVREAMERIETLLVVGSNNQIVAFMGIDADKVEMLFVAPDHFGQGIGRLLMNHAIEKFGIRQVDVNEQNPRAAEFYYHMDFEVFGRMELDPRGKPFPILKLRLRTNTTKQC